MCTIKITAEAPSTAQQSGAGIGSTTGGGSLVTVSGTLGGAVTSGIVTNGWVFFICTGVAGLTSGNGAAPTRAVSFFNSGPAEGAGSAARRGGGGGAALGGGAGRTGGRVGKLMRTGSGSSVAALGAFVSGRGGGVIRTGSVFGSFGSAIDGFTECAKIGLLSLVYLLVKQHFRFDSPFRSGEEVVVTAAGDCLLNERAD